MRYTFFEITNFKGIKSMRLDFSSTPESPIHTLVGLNESGKTTILEAINFFKYGRDPSLDPLERSGCAVSDIHDLIPISERSNFNDSITINAGLEIEDEDQEDLRKHLLAECGFRITPIPKNIAVAEVYPFKDSRHDPKEVKRLWTIELRGRGRGERKEWRKRGNTPEFQQAVSFLGKRMPRICYFPNFLFEFPDRIYLDEHPEHSDTAKKKHEFYRQVLQDILDSLDNNTNIGDHILQRAKTGDPNDKRSLEGLLLDMGRNVTKKVFDTWNQMFNRANAKKEVVIGVEMDEGGRWYAQFRIKDSDGYFAINERSLGFRWFFVYLLMTLYRGFRKNAPGKLLFLFDEPASNLHSSAQKQLLKSFEKLAECSVIYTTHSHHLINPGWLESTYVVRNAGLEYNADDDDFNAKKTEISAMRYRSFVAKFPSSTTYFQPVLDVLEYRPSELEGIPDAVMVEGKNDFYTLTYAQYLLGKGPSDPLHLLPGNGAGSLDNIIRLYIAWGKNFIVLLDSDGEAKKQKSRYLNAFGPILDGRLFTLSDLIEDFSGKALEGIFHEDDRLAIQSIAYPENRKFEKKHFNRAVQEAYLRKISISLSQQTSDTLHNLLTRIATKLDELRPTES